MPEYQEGSDPQNGLPSQQEGPKGDQLNPEQEQQELDAAQLKAQLEAERQEKARLLEERNQFETRFKDTQSAYHRSQEALKHLAGADPNQQRQANPVDELTQRIIATGKITRDPEQAKAFAEIMHSTISPLQQQNAYLHAAMQNTHQVDAVLKSAFQQDPALFQDPEVAAGIESYIRQEAMQAAQAGMPLNMEAFVRGALAYGAQEQYFRNKQNVSQNQQQPPRQQISTPNFRSMSGIQGGGLNRPAPTQVQKQYAPGQQELAQQMEDQLKAFGGKK